MSDYLLSVSQKKDILKNMREIDMHKELVILFEKMYGPKTKVHNTHGSNEFGRDIIICQPDPIKDINTAVVVKMDKLSGQSLDKPILDIIGQVQQCFEIDIKAKDSFNEISIDKVFIIVMGEISNNAAINLDAKLTAYKDRYTKLDINDMLDYFDNYYPEIFYGASGAHVLNKRYEQIEQALREKRHYNPNCFIEPNLKSFNKSKQEMIVISNSSNDKKVRAETMNNNIFGKKETIGSLANKIMSSQHYILVEGDAGSGKSIFTSKLTQYLIKEGAKNIQIKKNQTSNISIPVLIKATELKNGKLNNLNKILDTYYEESSINFDINLIIIDGLDEVDEESKINIISVVSQLCKEQYISLILTSRKSTVTRQLVDSFEKFELVPFETSQAINFIKKMASGKQKLLSALLKGFEQLKDQIPLYPMALSLLIEIVEEQEEVPASITELYSQYIEISLGKYSNTDNITVLFEPTIKSGFLQELAYEIFYKENVTSISLEKFDNFLVDYTSRHSSIHSIEEFKYDLSRVSILQIKFDSVEFSHKSFLDYFISSYYESNALTLYKNAQFDSVYECYHTTLWEDVTSFYFGIKKSIDKEDITKVLDSDPKSSEFLSAVHRFGIGTLIQYAWNSETAVKSYAIKEGISNIFNFKDLLYKNQTETFCMELPKIISDVSLMHLINESYSSVFLEQEIRNAIALAIDNIKTGTNDEKDNEIFYFGALFVITKAKSLDSSYVQNFIKDFIEIESKLDTSISLPIVALLRTATTKIQDNSKRLKSIKDTLQDVQRRLTKKYKIFSANLFSFKSRKDQMQLNEIIKGKH